MIEDQIEDLEPDSRNKMNSNYEFLPSLTPFDRSKEQSIRLMDSSETLSFNTIKVRDYV
jgi:hypothetical protein